MFKIEIKGFTQRALRKRNAKRAKKRTVQFFRFGIFIQSENGEERRYWGVFNNGINI
jgi:hypothetical protein